MNNLKNKFYILSLLISTVIFLNNVVKADELGIFLGAVSKHYCTCIFVSELEPFYCNTMLENLITSSLEDSELASASKEMKVDVNSDIYEINISIADRGVKSVFNGKKGCYLDTLN